MPTFQSPKRHHRPKRSRWAHCNTPAALRRRSAKRDAEREAMAALLPPVDPGPEPLSVWQAVQVLDAHGRVMHTIRLYVPTHGRCDQWAGEIDGQRCEAMLTATEVGRRVAAMICKRRSQTAQAQERAEAVAEWRRVNAAESQWQPSALLPT
jgi:hypothetical protein